MDTYSGHVWFGTFAAFLTVAAYVPYLRGVVAGRVCPHIFTWIVWGTATLLAFAAAWRAGGGWGAWVIGFSGVISFVVAALAYGQRAELAITRVDVLFFVAALAAIPLWVFARDPLWAVVLLTLIELLGFGPTFRKTWHAPRSESLVFLGLLIVRNVLILAALQQHTLITVLFPAAAALACLVLVVLMLWRRTQVAQV